MYLKPARTVVAACCEPQSAELHGDSHCLDLMNITAIFWQLLSLRWRFVSDCCLHTSKPVSDTWAPI